MAVSIDTCVQRWVDVNTCSPNARVVEASRVYFSGRSIFSYGSHFEMARALKDKHGKTILWLVNGDVFSPSTGRHQRSVRDHIARTDIPSVIIPFGALNAAGIDFDSVEALDISSDRIETTKHVSLERPPGSRWERRNITEHGPLTDEEMNALIASRHAKALSEWEGCRQYAADEADENGFWHRWLAQNPSPQPEHPEMIPHYLRSTTRVLGTRDVLVFGRNGWAEIDVTIDDDGVKRYRWQTQRHWLGESLIRARITEVRTFICPACKGSGTRSYAPTNPWDRRYVIPEYVLTSAGRDYAWEDYTQRRRDWEATWGPNGTHACGFCLGQRRTSERVTRTAKFMSGFDRNESRPSYFFCELPRTRATDIESALEALKPDTVRLAEQMGRDVKRQGDIFAVAMPGLTKRDLSKLKATYAKGGRLFGTNHAATETATLPDGTLLARGTLRHVPENGRPPDHARISLGDGWRVIVKNTVPLARA